MSLVLPLLDLDAPEVALDHLDHLWFQVAGTLCNLRCTHCFNDSGPGNRTFDLMSLEQFEHHLDAAVRLGVKECYVTGGEPFVNPDLVRMLELALEVAPATVLTNGTMLHPASIERLAGGEARSPYSLEFRVSLDGCTAEQNDALRGAGSFERTMAGMDVLLDHGFLPLVTVMAPGPDTTELLAGFVSMLRSRGHARPRLKFLPPLRIGGEARRTGGYGDDERITHEMLGGFDRSQLLCTHSRVATDRGVFVCPILVEAPTARLGAELTDALGPASLRYHACSTCYRHGSICANPSAGGRDA